MVHSRQDCRNYAFRDYKIMHVQTLNIIVACTSNAKKLEKKSKMFG
jgi:hypothetical protein